MRRWMRLAQGPVRDQVSTSRTHRPQVVVRGRAEVIHQDTPKGQVVESV